MSKTMAINYTDEVKIRVYDLCAFTFSNFSLEEEGKAYAACNYMLNANFIVSRTAKLTPKKQGQFVTFWKRGINEIRPFHVRDKIDFFVVNVVNGDNFGQFVFPKSVLISKRIISTDLKEGKCGFRVYTPWDVVVSSQAQKTKQWQCEYFLDISDIKSIDLQYAKQLYAN